MRCLARRRGQGRHVEGLRAVLTRFGQGHGVRVSKLPEVDAEESGSSNDGARFTAAESLRVSTAGHARAVLLTVPKEYGPTGHHRREGRGTPSEAEPKKRRASGAGCALRCVFLP